MSRPNRFQIMELYKSDIISALKTRGEILGNVDINSTFLLHRDDWKLPGSTKIQDFFEFLIDRKKILKPIELESPKETVTKYHFLDAKVEPLDLALSLYPNLYLSHYSAVSHHDLTNEIIKSIYVNKEQSNKVKYGAGPDICQDNIDAAFSKPMRQTNRYFDYNNQRIYVLNGRFTDQLGVISNNGIRVTNLERTLVDIAVRPEYSGGVYEVLSVFERAKGEVSVNKMKSYLTKLDYIYPYHQALGFYLERAGYKENVIRLMESIPMEYDFYLTYGIEDKAYSPRWHLYYPKNI